MDPSWTVTSADGTRLAGYELGGDGEIVLIAHATGFCGPMYRMLARELTKTFRVVAFDFRAHGRSVGSAGLDVSWERMADDAIAVLDHTGGPVHGFGHSMGGAALLTAASRSPSSFSSLFLFEPIVFIESPVRGNQLEMSSVARRRRSRFGSRAEVVARYAANRPFENVLAGCLADYVEHGFVDSSDGGVELACDPEHEAEIFEHGLTSTLEHIGAVSTPTMIAVGREDDGAGPARLGAPLAGALSSANLAIYHHIDHLGPFQDPWSIARDFAAHVHATTCVPQG